MFKYYYNNILWNSENRFTKSQQFQEQFVSLKKNLIDDLSIKHWKEKREVYEGVEVLEEKILQLRPRQRNLLFDYYLGKLTMEEIAKKWKCSREWVRLSLDKALFMLKEEF